MNTRWDNDIINRTDTIYVKNKKKLSWLIGPSMKCDENQARNDVTDRTNVVYAKNETKLSW